MGTQTLELHTALALYLPRTQPLFKDLFSGMIHLSRLEEDISRRNRFHGVVEFVTGSDGAQVLYVDGVRSAILLTAGLGTRVQQFEDLANLDATVSLYQLDPTLTRVATGFSMAQPLDYSRAIQQMGLEQTLNLLTESGSSNVLHLLSFGAKAQVFMDEGRIVHAQLLTEGHNPEQPVTLELLVRSLGSGEVRGVLYQTKEPTRPMVSASSPAASSPAAAQPEAAPPATAPANSDPRLILEGWSDLMRRTRTLAQHNGISNFDRAWRSAGVALCDTHPLLDPFGADLTWNDGTFQLHADSTEGLLEALTAGFVHTLSALGISLEQVLINLKLVDLAHSHPHASLERLLPGGRRIS
jgi:hypothetical protein